MGSFSLCCAPACRSTQGTVSLQVLECSHSFGHMHTVRSVLRHESSPGATSLRSGSSSCIVKAPSSARDSKRKQVSSCSSTCALALYTGSLNFSGLRALSYLYSSSSFCVGQRQPG